MVPDRDLYALLSDVCRQLDAGQSLEALSKRSGWSKFHLHRAIKQILGETPKQYVTRLRVERSAALLASSSQSILSIGLSVGYASHEVFARSFKRLYGVSPAKYRSQALSGRNKTERRQHQTIVQSTGPCVRLFGASSTQVEGNITMSQPEIRVRDLKSQPILFIQRTVPQAQLQPLFAECFPKIYTHCMNSGIAMAGQPIARYVSIGPGLWTVDCAIPLVEAGSDEGEIQAGALQAGTAVVALHYGPYEKLVETYAAIEQWIADNNAAKNGSPWEVYVTDPAQHPDPAHWKTEVFWPIAK